METVELLRDTRALLDEPVKWTKGAYAKADPEDDPEDDPDGDFSPLAKSATCWCLVGAMSRVLKVDYDSEGSKKIEEAARVLGFGDVSSMVAWNDDQDRTYPEVVTRLNNAIRELEASNAY